MKTVIGILKKILLAIELVFFVAFLNWDKVLFLSIIAVDQFVKGVVVSSMTLGESIPVIPDVLHITYILNPGAAFGILPYQRMFFVTIGLVLIIAAVLLYPRLQKSDSVLKFGVISLLSGAISNLIDRVQSGLVVDFLDIRVWPIFNIADVAIVIGMFVVIYSIIFKMDSEGRRVEEVKQ